MITYRCEVKTYSRAAGHSSTSAAAYRNGTKIINEMSGKIDDYTHKKGVVHSAIVLPNSCARLSFTSEKLWNEVEKKEARKNSTVAREFLVLLPRELDKNQRLELAKDITKNLVERFGFAAEYSVHDCKKDTEDNHHVHILTTTRKITNAGFAEKIRELDEKKSSAIPDSRKLVETVINKHLEFAGIKDKCDCRSKINILDEALQSNNLELATLLLAKLQNQKNIGWGNKSVVAVSENNEIKKNSALKFNSLNNEEKSIGKNLKEVYKHTEQTKPTVKAFEPSQLQEKAKDFISQVCAVASKDPTGPYMRFVMEEGFIFGKIQELKGRLTNASYEQKQYIYSMIANLELDLAKNLEAKIRAWNCEADLKQQQEQKNKRGMKL